MVVYLVIDNSAESKFKRYDERYVIFTEFPDARNHAIRRGYQEGFARLSETSGGICQNFSCGDIDISLITLETK